MAWVGLGAVLYAVAGVTGRVRHGTRGRITAGQPTVEHMAATNDGRLLAVDGSFTRIGGRHRYQVALIDLADRSRVSSWRTDAFERSMHPYR